jgi:hypothetical protein
MAMPAAQKAVVGAVQPQEIGQAAGAFMMLRILGGVFGVAVTVAVFAGSVTAAMTAVAAFALVGMLVALGVPGKRPAAVTAASVETRDERA